MSWPVVGGALVVLYLYVKSRSDKKESGNRKFDNGNDRYSPRSAGRFARSTTYAAVQRQQAKAAKKYDDNDDFENVGEEEKKKNEEVDDGEGEMAKEITFYNLGILIQFYNHALKLHICKHIINCIYIFFYSSKLKTQLFLNFLSFVCGC